MVAVHHILALGTTTLLLLRTHDSFHEAFWKRVKIVIRRWLSRDNVDIRLSHGPKLLLQSSSQFMMIYHERMNANSASIGRQDPLLMDLCKMLPNIT